MSLARIASSLLTADDLRVCDFRFEDAVSAHEQTLNAAEELLETLAAAGVRGQKRDFADVVDVNRAAISLLSSTRGAMLRHRWLTL